jgi:hypothetical protein
MRTLATFALLWAALGVTPGVFGQRHAQSTRITTATHEASGDTLAGPIAPRGDQRAFLASDDDVLGVPVFGHAATGRAGENCPQTGFICGQDRAACGSTQWYFYSDMQFCSSAPTTCQRVRCENFPPPGVTIPPSQSIGVIMWWGVYVDNNSNGCTKTGGHQFRIRFYNEMNDGNDPVDPGKIVYTEYVTAWAQDTGETVTFATVPAVLWQFTAVLTTPVNTTSGFFSIAGDGTPGCYFLWGGSNDGNNWLATWYETRLPGTWEVVTNRCDLSYCFSQKDVGACCDDCAESCLEAVTDTYCHAIGGRFLQDGTCADFGQGGVPACGAGVGACCHDDGTCVLTICQECEAGPPPPCIGDLNCDGMIDFADINPFVLYLSDQVSWTAAFACDPRAGDINCDGTYGQWSFDDINPFVTLMTQCGVGCACPGPISCSAPPMKGPYWTGVGTTCDPWPVGACCTVVVPPGALTEGEPEDCAPDTFNGGCDMASPLFSAIAPGQTIYGESGTFGGTRDTDWYHFALPGPRSFTITVEAEFDVTVAAYRQGPTPAAPCVGRADAVAPTSGARCTQVVLESRCLPGGDYLVVVAPTEVSGVPCYADYKLTLTVSGACEVLNTCGDCPAGADYLEGSPPGNPPPGYCIANPDDPTYDPENGGCNTWPPTFEVLPLDSDEPITFCGKLWANQGYRDLDWYALELATASQVMWQVTSEVPCRATLLFDYVDGVYSPPPADCSTYYYWLDTLVEPCVPKLWTGTMVYEPGLYWFLVMPEDAGGSLRYGYPCPVGSADFGNDYTVTINTGLGCSWLIQTRPSSHKESQQPDGNDPPCPPGSYDDTFNSGCDAATPPGPRLELSVGDTPTWLGRTGTWYADPNDPDLLQKDFDWYEFTLTTNRRFKVHLFAEFAATWEIWRSNDCPFGPIEGLDVPLCYDFGVYTVRCYAAGTYWLRVYPTGQAQCGKYYWLALTEPANCTPCYFACVGDNLDDPCGEYTDDSNLGCDNPTGPPPRFMTFNCGTTYCGRVYAGSENGAQCDECYDPDWFTVTQTNATPRRIRLSAMAEFLAHVECYASCDDYPNTPIAGLDGITPLTGGMACPTIQVISASQFPEGTTIYGRIVNVDQFGGVLTKYYPCAKGVNRWRIAVACVP